MSKHLAEQTERTVVLEHVEKILADLYGYPEAGTGRRRESAK